MTLTAQVPIEIAYALPEQQVMLSLNVDQDTTVYDAVLQSGITKKFPEIDLAQQALGIFGKVVRKPREQPVKPGDRIEIYRPVTKSPSATESDHETLQP